MIAFGLLEPLFGRTSAGLGEFAFEVFRIVLGYG